MRALTFAAVRGHLSTVRKLIEGKEMDVNFLDDHKAACNFALGERNVNNSSDLIAYLENNGARTGEQILAENTPINYATSKENLDLIKALLATNRGDACS